MDELKNQLLVGEARGQLAEVPDDTVQLTVTSPPYNLGKDYGSTPDRQSIDEWNGLMSDVIEQLYRVTRPDGKVCINVAASFESGGEDGRYRRVPLRTHIVTHAREVGLELQDEFVWVKHQYGMDGEGALLGSYPYPPNIPINQRHEYILVFRKPGETSPEERPGAGDPHREASKLPKEEWREYAQSVWELPRATTGGDGDHPAVFPVELPRRLIKLYSFAGDLILDPFVGTGTTAVAALQTGRAYLGIDRNEDYVATARKRVGDPPDEPDTSLAPADPEPPEEIPKYIHEGLDRQDPETLRRIAEFSKRLATHREFIPEEGIESKANAGETITDIERTHTGAIVEKRVPCGKDNCTTCPHGPYRYRVYRDEGNLKSDYLGPS